MTDDEKRSSVPPNRLWCFASYLKHIPHRHIHVIAIFVCRPLISEVRQESAVLPSESDAGRQLIQQVGHIRLVLVAIAYPEIVDVLSIQAIGNISLPSRCKVELSLNPSAPALHAMLARSANGQHGLSGGNAKDAQRASLISLSGEDKFARDRQRVIHRHAP